ncbi:MAG: TIGR04282 family arsenosugar biosynthesis glycosyltransferase, partial [Thermoanaerobaculia bacterium]|nr:TIGR04282 family arsenosugar biosynthesis glycosyltransferase [Thermoanaerobaculia bacterium]
MSHLLLIFTKNPVLGKVKTRLAATVGDAEALRIYQLLLEKTRRAALDVEAGRWLFYSDFLEPDDDWPETYFQKKLQTGHDLGERMENAFRQAFASGAGKVVIIGCDCPDLNGVLLQEAFQRLNEADFVLGPATDGGYYLLGMRQLEPALFRGI